MKKFFVFLLVFVLLIISQNCDDNNEVNDESEFEAGITCYPDFGTKYTEFKFSIIILSDTDTLENTDNFQIRWDFDGDGAYDTDWIDSFSITHQFNTPGTYETEVTLKDSLGDLNESSIHVYVQEMIQITTNESGSYQGNIDWCPDGSNRIAFDWRSPSSFLQIFVVEYPDGQPVQITTANPNMHYNFPEWSPDGEKICSEANNKIYIIELATGQIQEIPGYGMTRHWSPDGKWIMMYHEKTNLYDVEGDSLVLFSNKRYESCWSPDGQYLALYEKLAYPEVSDKLEIMDFSSRSIIKEFTVSDIGFKIDWSPDGKWIMLGFEPDNHLLILNYETGKIYTGILNGLDHTWYPTWSSDGTLIAFEAELIGSNRKAEIWAVTAPEFMR